MELHRGCIHQEELGNMTPCDACLGDPVDIYQHVPTKMIAETAKRFGPMGRVARPVKTELMGWPALAGEPAYKTENVTEMAVERMLELEQELAAMHKWQDDLAATMRRLSPSDRAGQNERGWELLCRHVRHDFREIEEHVVEAIWERKRKEAEEGR